MVLPAADQLARAAAAARTTEPQLAAARRAARDAVGVKHSGGNWFSRQLDRFASWLADHLPNPAFSFGGGNVARLVTWMVLIAIVVGVVVLLVRAAHRWRPGAAAEPRAAVGREQPQSPFDQARSRALGMARSDPREALRTLYIALLHELGSRRGWRFQPGRSNWAFVRRLGPSSEPGAALAECTRLFEGRVYGSVPAAAGDVERVAVLADAVLA